MATERDPVVESSGFMMVLEYSFLLRDTGFYELLESGPMNI
jgi:hypothetical protein